MSQTPRRITRLPLRLLVAAIVVVPVLVASFALATMLFTTSRHISESLGSSVIETETARVSEQIRSYLSEAMRVSDLYTRRIEMGVLPLTDLEQWEPYMRDDLFTSKRIASICFGNRKGQSTYLQLAHGRRELGRVNGPGDGQAVEYEVNQYGQIVGPPLRVYRYDPRQRPWYSVALRTAGPKWTPVYFWFGITGGEAETGVGYTRVINDHEGNYAGVLSIDVTLGAFSDFLHNLPFATLGSIFVVDDKGYLIAATDGSVISSAGERLRLEDSSVPVAREISLELKKYKQDTPEILRVVADGDSVRVRVTNEKPQGYPGINWRIITVIPETAFLTDARLAQRRAVILAVLATIGALGLGLLLGRRITVPLLRLRDHVHRIGSGDFDSRLDLGEARELSHLATATNEMASGLKHRMRLEQALSLATQVQQSLLPQDVSPPPGLDIAGISRYCDQTGGDYFDFVEITGMPKNRMLIAVGDVTGHGIAAALLMTTARAALRTGALANDSLSTILTKVNHILARDAPLHERYMTMVLLTIDPEAHTVRWCSAGHDPVLVYHPYNGEFVELREGDIMLGAVDEVCYAEHSYANLHPGTILFIGTDGVWESKNSSNEMFGKDRLRAFLKSHAHKSAADMVRELEHDLIGYRQDCPAADDVTYVIVKMLGVQSHAAVSNTARVHA